MNIFRVISIVGVIKVLAKVSALIRDRVIALTVGTGAAADAFFLAFTASNSLKNIIGEESLKASFLPLFAESALENRKQDLWNMVNTVVNTMAVVLALVAAGGLFAAPYFIRMAGPGFTGMEQAGMAVNLFKILLPSIVFGSLAMVLFCMLISLGRFTVPAALPLVMNALIVAGALLLYRRLGPYALAVGVLSGSVVQWLIQLPHLYREGYRYRPVLNWRHPVLKKLFGLMVPVVLMQSLIQITILVDTAFASTLDTGSISFLYYGNRLMLFPYDIVGMAISMVVFPALARAAARDNARQMRELLGHSLRLLLFIGIPVTLGSIVLARPLVAAVYGGSNFGWPAVTGASRALIWYMAGLVGFTGIRIICTVFYSVKDTRTPFYVGIVGLVLNVILDYVLIKYMSFSGLALASSIVAILNAGLLIYLVQKRIGKLNWAILAGTAGKSAGGALPMAAVCWFVMVKLSSYGVLVQAAAGVVAGSVCYLVVTGLLGSSELRMVKKSL